MTGEEMKEAIGHSAHLRVRSKSGSIYDIDRDVIFACDEDSRPYIYGWPVVPRWHRSYGRVRWFYAENVQPVECNA